MLFAIEGNGDLKQVTRLPHEAEYRIWRSRLTDPEFDAIYEALRQRIDGREIDTAGWIPGAKWAGTPYMPIYERACARNEEEAGKFFGLIVWKVVMEHPDSWSFGRYAVGSVPIESMTYFRINQPGT